MHISPQPAGSPDPSPNDRSVSTIAWFAEEAAKPQHLDPWNMTTPIPSFTIATGDLTEYGPIAKTWSNFERYFSALDMRLYVAVGNHDNTWTGMMQVMRQRHGGDHYSFSESGCHFVCINTATPQDPMPSLEQRTLTWLADDLSRVARDTPVFIFCHHPLSSSEFAKPFEQLRFLDVIRKHHVVLLLMGHGHRPLHEQWGTLDCVMGGATFQPPGKTDYVGYNIISIQGGFLRVVYRYRDPAKPMQVLLNKRIEATNSPRLELISPAGVGDRLQVASQDSLSVEATAQGGFVKEVICELDGVTSTRQRMPGGGDGEFSRYRSSVSLTDLLPGVHFVRVTAMFDDFELDRGSAFIYAPEDSAFESARVTLSAGMKAQPVIDGDGCIVATTNGDIVRVRFPAGTEPVQRVIHEAGAEVLHAPTLREGTLYVSCGDMTVSAIDLDGRVRWKSGVGASVYGTPAVTADAVYVGDLEGFVTALDRGTGRLLWAKRHAVFSIEQSLTHHEGTLYFGAWDGWVYAVTASDGSLRWKARCPAGQSPKRQFKSRYYAAADCSPIVVGDRLIVADRAYRLGAYSLDGDYLGDIAEDVVAVTPTADGAAFYARGKSRGIAKYRADGELLWSTDIETGRFPVVPVEQGGMVYCCSDKGTLRALDAGSGSVKWAYQVSPQLHIMAPVAVSGHRAVFAVGMDGSVTWLRHQ